MATFKSVPGKPLGCVPGQPTKENLGLYCLATGTPFACRHGLVCQIVMPMPVDSTAYSMYISLLTIAKLIIDIEPDEQHSPFSGF
jgi:hypothetical protein